jgi:hypothetical protein
MPGFNAVGKLAVGQVKFTVPTSYILSADAAIFALTVRTVTKAVARKVTMVPFVLTVIRTNTQNYILSASTAIFALTLPVPALVKQLSRLVTITTQPLRKVRSSSPSLASHHVKAVLRKVRSSAPSLHNTREK